MLFFPPNSSGEVKTLQSLNAQQSAMITLIEANFTQMVQYLSQERDTALKDRDTYHQQTITLRKDNTMLIEQLATYSRYCMFVLCALCEQMTVKCYKNKDIKGFIFLTRKCKEDFAHSLDGIQTVTRDFLNKINNLFPHQLTFHLTCERQQEQMEKIRNSCTNLSRDVENKFQMYLDNVGNKVCACSVFSDFRRCVTF